MLQLEQPTSHAEQLVLFGLKKPMGHMMWQLKSSQA